MAIDEAQLKLYFVRGMMSLRMVLEKLEERKAYRSALRTMAQQLPEQVPNVPGEINKIMVKSIEESLNEIGREEFAVLATVLQQERTAWAGLARIIVDELAANKDPADIIKGFEKLLEGIHDKETALLPQDAQEKNVQKFLEAMATIKKKRVLAAAKRK